eukprot:jgi/Astpho2/1367/Aster-x1005
MGLDCTRHQHAKGTGRVHLIWALRQQRQGLGPGSTVLLLLVRSRLQLGSNVTPQSLKLGVGASDLVNQRIQLALLWCRQLPGASLLQEVHLEIATLVVVKRVHIGLQLCLKGLNLRLLFAIGLPPHQGCSTEHHKSAWRAACCWQEKVQAVLDKAAFAPSRLSGGVLEVRNILDRPDWERAYGLVIPVLTVVSQPGSAEVKIPRPAPRMTAERLGKHIETALDTERT